MDKKLGWVCRLIRGNLCLVTMHRLRSGRDVRSVARRLRRRVEIAPLLKLEAVVVFFEGVELDPVRDGEAD